MELRQLEYFRVIAETESIHEAARRLNMSQPPLSYQLKQLEAELNVTLFERTRQGVRLTEAGKLLYDRSANLLEYVKSTELEVAKVGKKRVLRLGITPTTVATIMPCVSLFSRRNPDVNFEVHDGITYTLYRYLMDGIIDISIARTPLRLDDVDYKILSSEPMIAVSSKDMLPEKNGSLKLSDLLNIPLIIYRRYEALIMDAFHSRGMEPDLFCVCDDPRGAMLWAKEGLATAIFPQSMIIGWAINSAMILMAAATFFQPQNAKQVDDLATAGKMLTPLIGNAASVIFAAALLLAGISSSITAGMAGGTIFSGIFNKSYEIKSKETRWGILLTMIPAAAVILLIDSPFQGLLYSQMFLGMQLPITVFTQIYLTSSKKVMGKYANSLRLKIALFAIAVIVTLLNIALLFVQ